MKKVAVIATLITLFHLIEDLIWLTLGRYTDLPYWLVVLAIILMGFFGGLLVRHPKVKNFLGN